MTTMRSARATLLGPVVALLLAASGGLAQTPTEPCNPICLSARARAALADGDIAEYLRLAGQLAARVPGHTAGSHALARAHALAGHADSAVFWLGRLASAGAAFDATSDSAFASLTDHPRFGDVEARLAANRRAIVGGRVAFEIEDPDLLPEAMDRDPVHGGWIIGSQAKRTLVRADDDGALTGFVSDPEVLRVVGIAVDTLHSVVWFASWDAQPEGGAAVPGAAHTRLFRADLTSGRILARYEPRDDAGDHLLNDIAIARDGAVFITDTRQGWLYRIAEDADSLEVFLRPDRNRFTGANGIALTSDGRTLYVAFVEGIARIDLATRDIDLLPTPPGVSAHGMDGLYLYDRALIGVQNAFGLHRVVRFELAPDGRSIRAAHVLERGNAFVRLPTTGALVGDRLYYIANSQIERLAPDGTLIPPRQEPAPRTVVRVIELR